MAAPFGLRDSATFLAPMQDISDAGFMRIVADRGAPDFFMAEYFRIHENFEFDPHVLESLLCKPAERPVCAQFIGENEADISRAISELRKIPQIGMLDLNLGCPAPKIYRKNVGGGLLRSPEKIRSILRVMRGEWGGCLSVKMRTGFDSDADFARLLEAVLENSPDFITVHARTVKQLYRGEPNYAKISEAVSISPVPIIANGDITSAQKALKVISDTGCAGVMVGRHAVRNPWIFRQMRELFSGVEKVFCPTLGDVREYVQGLVENASSYGTRHLDSRLKKFLNFVGTAVDEKGAFLHEMRRARGIDELLKVCDFYLAENPKKPYPPEPYAGLCSRPNHESRE